MHSWGSNDIRADCVQYDSRTEFKIVSQSTDPVDMLRQPGLSSLIWCYWYGHAKDEWREAIEEIRSDGMTPRSGYTYKDGGDCISGAFGRCWRLRAERYPTDELIAAIKHFDRPFYVSSAVLSKIMYRTFLGKMLSADNLTTFWRRGSVAA